MQNHDWIELFRLIPEDQHNTLVLTTLSGVDLAIELLIRSELTYVVFRGRVCGQTDDGRVFFLPYCQIDFLQINRVVKEVEIHELFGTGEGAKSSLHSAPAGSGLGVPVMAPPKSGFAAVSAPGSSPQISPHVPGMRQTMFPRQAPAPTVTGRVPNVPSAALQPPGVSMTNIPAAALVPPPAPGPGNGAGGTTAPRNSILERLRAQRNAILPPRAPGR